MTVFVWMDMKGSMLKNVWKFSLEFHLAIWLYQADDKNDSNYFINQSYETSY